ncbi:MAG: hypothetical protein IJ727_03275, partial [Treponema sp.]|nr:hypothetical protein [Treponema sp.]
DGTIYRLCAQRFIRVAAQLGECRFHADCLVGLLPLHHVGVHGVKKLAHFLSACSYRFPLHKQVQYRPAEQFFFVFRNRVVLNDVVFFVRKPTLFFVRRIEYGKGYLRFLCLDCPYEFFPLCPARLYDCDFF